MPSISTSPPDALVARQRAMRALDRLVRSELARGWGVGSARLLAWVVALGTLLAIGVVARSADPDNAVLAMIARAAALTVTAGALAALVLSAPAKNAAMRDGLVALARAHRLGGREVRRSELVALLRVVGEVAAGPLVALTVLVVVLVARGHASRWGWALLGSVAFGAVAALLLGALAWACRRGGGDAGRRWFLAFILIPWVVGEASCSGPAGPWMSIPGALTQLWRAFTAVGS